MIKSLLTKAGRIFIMLLIMVIITFNYGFKVLFDETEWLNWSNKFLTESYDPSVDLKLKKYEITLTSDHFIRLRKTFQHGKQEYFSFNLSKLDSMNYVAAPNNNGLLRFKTIKDDIIVQTYEDPKGDIDSMASILDIPVKSISPERLDSLNEALKYFKDKGL